MKRVCLFVALLLSVVVASYAQTVPLSIAVADNRYGKIAGGSFYLGTTTFANITVSGTCSGCTTGAVPTTRLISTTAPLGGGGDLSADRTLTCTLCLVSGGALGTPSSGTGTNITGIPEAGVTNLTTDLAGKQATGNYITALTGNVVASGPGSVVATIQPGVVTSAMLNITATTCTNQFLSATSATGIGTCTALTLAAFPTMATNTVLGNATSGTAVPTALAVSTCSGASNALNWTTNTGFGCNGSITASSATTATTATNATNAAITDDTTTNATVFPLWVTASTGNLPAKVSSTKLGFNPSTGNITISSTSKMGWGSSGITTPDTFLVREAANTLAMNNGTTPQLFRIYNTDDGAGNVERGTIAWSSNVLIFQTSQTGTGAARDVNMGPSGAAAVCLRTTATCRLNVAAGGDLTMAAGNSTGQCTLNGAATSTCTHTVPAACVPICTYNSGATPHTIACSVSATTLTAVSATTLDSGTVNYHCF